MQMPGKQFLPGHLRFNRSSEHRCEIFFRRFDGHEVKFLMEQIENRRRQESGQRRSDPDVAYAEMKQRQQHGYRFLLIP